MARFVDYWQDTTDDSPCWSDGPFVLCGAPIGAGGYRVEVKRPGHRMPVCPSPSVNKLREAECGGMLKDEAVDFLNAQVRAGRIVLDASGAWAVKGAP